MTKNKRRKGRGTGRKEEKEPYLGTNEVCVFSSASSPRAHPTSSSDRARGRLLMTSHRLDDRTQKIYIELII